MSSEPVFESKADPETVVKVALLVPARLPGDAPGRACPVQAGERDALRVRHLHHAGRDGLRLLAEADDERGAARVAVLAREPQQVAEARVVDAGGLGGV